MNQDFSQNEDAIPAGAEPVTGTDPVVAADPVTAAAKSSAEAPPNEDQIKVDEPLEECGKTFPNLHNTVPEKYKKLTIEIEEEALEFKENSVRNEPINNKKEENKIEEVAQDEEEEESDVGTKRQLIWKAETAADANPFANAIVKDIEKHAADMKQDYFIRKEIISMLYLTDHKDMQNLVKRGLTVELLSLDAVANWSDINRDLIKDKVHCSLCYSLLYYHSSFEHL